ncbi:LysR substrate-binding domain-containing protein [Acidocella aminolytica]|jgi:LysR family nod box-dependent transcriptional activator|uniref:Transcriptional regulator LysR n=1 Tax=Acidocella aminolytica 101 = DSM 11237 TaxID=1120923 RepID=A0A0D6PIA1_9PROT|nr:LysR substrate-binding domain-containing protein [Acidocella aminolytica]GAN80933.1 transcriptional regulator LysR [Acidocella aminolytica 101 = DSM 11237]GBQ34746.1 LysR family transcriptional regulator [Acidocella aminolytica 101 = DSM 11237]SHF10308.1 DNA-binding transcriptional regulator, LysR family [Acidocella aminolytica 101 = DSM 11237]
MRINSLDLNLLIVLDALLTHENVTRVAEQLNVTQPTISNALSRLRLHFKDELLVMLGRRMVPTPLANRLRDPVSELLRQAQRVALTRSNFDPAEAETDIAIAASDYVVDALMLDVQRELLHRAPRINTQIVSVSAPARQRFADGQMDLMFHPPEFVNTNDYFERVFEDKFVPVIWEGNDAIGATLPLAAFQSMPYAAIEFGESSHISQSDLYFSRAGITRNIRLRLPNYINLAAAVIGTPLLASLPWLLARHWVGKGLRVVKPDFTFPTLPEVMCWPAHLNDDPGNQWLRGLVKDKAQRLQALIDAAFSHS